MTDFPFLTGPDGLGALHYTKQLINGTNPGSAGGIFLRTFGDAKKATKRIIESGKFSEFVIHMAKFEHDHDYNADALLPQLTHDAEFLEGVAIKNQFCKIFLSPFCEHNINPQKMSQIFGKLQKVAPHCFMLNSVEHAKPVAGITTEYHIGNPNKLPIPAKGDYTVSFDGCGGTEGIPNFPNCDVHSILQRYANAVNKPRHIRWWNFRMNGKYGLDDTAGVDERSHWPDVHYIKTQNAMMKVREGYQSWPKTALYKVMAEDHGNGDTRANKAMCIIPEDHERVAVKDMNGTVVCFMKRFPGDYTGVPKGARYYASLHSYQIGDLAERNTGHRIVRIGEQTIAIDADLRSGLFK